MSREENRDSFYPPARDYQESEKGIDQLIRSVYGDLSPEDMADVKAQRMQRIRLRREKATKEAQKILREVNRPVCRRDMMAAMDMSIMNQVRAFEKTKDIRNAALLVAIVVCKNILTDGPLYEGD